MAREPLKVTHRTDDTFQVAVGYRENTEVSTHVQSVQFVEVVGTSDRSVY